MRQILVDWLVDVAEHFDLKSQTLHLTIALIDRFLLEQQTPQSKTDL
jgi:hypothetical protein